MAALEREVGVGVAFQGGGSRSQIDIPVIQDCEYAGSKAIGPCPQNGVVACPTGDRITIGYAECGAWRTYSSTVEDGGESSPDRSDGSVDEKIGQGVSA